MAAKLLVKQERERRQIDHDENRCIDLVHRSADVELLSDVGGYDLQLLADLMHCNFLVHRLVHLPGYQGFRLYSVIISYKDGIIIRKSYLNADY